MWGGSVENGDVIRFAIRPLMMDFIEKADAAMQPGSHRTADLRFGHDTSILPLFALMGVDDPQNRNLPYKEAHAKGWYAFFQVPMATNCQMIFYQNKKGEVLTKVLYNRARSSRRSSTTKRKSSFPASNPSPVPTTAGTNSRPISWTSARRHPSLGTTGTEHTDITINSLIL